MSNDNLTKSQKKALRQVSATEWQTEADLAGKGVSRSSLLALYCKQAVTKQVIYGSEKYRKLQ